MDHTVAIIVLLLLVLSITLVAAFVLHLISQLDHTEHKLRMLASEYDAVVRQRDHLEDLINAPVRPVDPDYDWSLRLIPSPAQMPVREPVNYDLLLEDYADFGIVRGFN